MFGFTLPDTLTLVTDWTAGLSYSILIRLVLSLDYFALTLSELDKVTELDVQSLLQ